MITVISWTYVATIVVAVITAFKITDNITKKVLNIINIRKVLKSI